MPLGTDEPWTIDYAELYLESRVEELQKVKLNGTHPPRSARYELLWNSSTSTDDGL